MLSSSPWLYIVALLFIGVLASVPGLLAFRRQIHTDALPSVSMKREIADLKQERLELSAQIIKLQNEVEKLRSQLKQFNGMRETVDRLLLENIELRRQIDAMQKGKPVPSPITDAGQQTVTGKLGPLLERERVVTSALDVIEYQIVAQGGEARAGFELILQRDGLKKTLREIEDEVDRLHLEDK